MKNKSNSRDGQGLNRREFLKISGGGALAALIAGAGGRALLQRGQVVSAAPVTLPQQMLPREDIRMVATDGFVSLPGRRFADDNALYVFGFRDVLPADETADPQTLIQKYKGKVILPAPIVVVGKNVDLYLTMTNLGFDQRPDLDDAHTIHWHGFRNPKCCF